jgi:hypothetical protein
MLLHISIFTPILIGQLIEFEHQIQLSIPDQSSDKIAAFCCAHLPAIQLQVNSIRPDSNQAGVPTAQQRLSVASPRII